MIEKTLEEQRVEAERLAKNAYDRLIKDIEEGCDIFDPIIKSIETKCVITQKTIDT